MKVCIKRLIVDDVVGENNDEFKWWKISFGIVVDVRCSKVVELEDYDGINVL